MKLSHFFYMPKSDRKVLMGFLLVALVSFGAMLWVGTSEPDEAEMPVDEPAQQSYTQITPPISLASPSVEPHSAERFPFDPNTADSVQLLRLGLKPWQVRNIYKYRASGGVYQTKEDFAQLYGLTLKDYQELEPYIRIADAYRPAARFVKRERQERDTLLYPMKIAEGETIDLATADTALLRKVPGIGTYYAREIVKYRNRLGGFSSVDQLDEIDGFPAASKKFFRIGRQPSVRLNLNKLSLNELKRHPYLNYYQARAIIDFRRQHGKMKELRELQLLQDFSDEDIRRLAPYVEF